jgi:hypothetical protein
MVLGSYRRVVVVADVLEVVPDVVEVVCSSPWQTFCQVEEAMSYDPLPNLSTIPNWSTHAKSASLDSTVV